MAQVNAFDDIFEPMESKSHLKFKKSRSIKLLIALRPYFLCLSI